MCVCECYSLPSIRIGQSQQAAVASAPIELMKGATKLAQIDLHMIMGMCGNKWIIIRVSRSGLCKTRLSNSEMNVENCNLVTCHDQLCL